MKSDTANNTSPIRLQITNAGGLFAAFLGFFTIVGWVFHLPGLSTFGKAYIPMAPSTAILFLGFGSVIFLIKAIQGRKTYRLIAGVFVGSGTLLAALLYYTAIRGIFHPAEALGMTMDAVTLDVPLGHMSPITAVLFFFTGLSLLFTLYGKATAKRKQWAGLLTVTIVFLAGSFLVLAYMLGSPAFYGSLTIPPALPTSLSFLTMGGSLMVFYASNIWEKTFSRTSREIKPVVSLSVLFLLLASGIVMVGYYNHRAYASQFRAEAENRLQAIGQFKAKELTQWRKERLDDAHIFYKNPYLSRLTATCLGDPSNPDAVTALEEMMRLMHSSRNYNLFSLIDKEGNELLAYPTGENPVSSRITGEINRISVSGRVEFLDFYRNDRDGNIYLAMVVPVFNPFDMEEVIASLVIRIDPDDYLYPMISEWPGSGKTGETLIVRREGEEVVFLNELRFAENTALNLKFRIAERPGAPPVLAVTGHSGIVEGIDYRDVPVFASLHQISDSPWYLISRMDIAEVYQALGKHLRNSIMLILMLIGLAGFGIFLGWRQQQLRFLREKILAAEASDRLKTAFMNNISHELRTPLNSILGFGQVMMQPGLSEDHKKEFLAMVQNSSNRLLNTVNNYMDISLITSGNMEYHVKPYGVKALLNELYQDFQPGCIAKGLELKLEVDPHEKIIHTSDAELVRKVLNLLLDNALKFTQKGSITFGCQLSDTRELTYFVRDTGIGVSDENIKNLYIPYWQEELENGSLYEGSGLGLPIAKGVIDLLGGHIEVKTTKDQGSAFTFHIPGAVTVQKTEVPESRPANGANGKKPLVLIAEDDENNALYYAFALEQAACELLFASNGKEAVDIVRTRPGINLVLMDLKMPVMNGFDATREIKKMRDDLPVVATTAYAMTHDEMRAREAGCDDYLSKPIRPGMLTETLRKYGLAPETRPNGKH